MEIRCQIIVIKHRFRKIHELETFGTRKRILRKKNWRYVATPESAQSCFKVSIHFPACIFFPRTFFSSSSRLVRYQTIVWKVQNTTGCFLAQLHPSNFFLIILFTWRGGIKAGALIFKMSVERSADISEEVR